MFVRRAVQGMALTVACFLGVAILSPDVLSAAISQGYHSNSKLADGSLAALKDSRSSDVVAADSSNNALLEGVVVGSKGATLELSSTGDVVQIATSGVAKTFVTDLAGAIKTGDIITTSPISGVGMKATASGKVVGVAKEDFNTANAVKTVTVKDNTGKDHTAKVGIISVNVQPNYYVPPQKKTILPAFLQQFVNNLAGHEVSPLRIIVSLIIFLIGVSITTTILITAVRSSIISIGRNPLAQTGIYKGLLQVILTTVGVLAMTLGSAYFLLTF